MPASFGNLPTGGGFNPNTYQPHPTSSYSDPTRPPPSQSGGNWVWDLAKGVWNFVSSNAGDILQTGAGLVEGYMSSADRQKQLDELRRQYDESLKQRQSEFDRGFGEQQTNRQDQEAQIAVQAATRLNAAPIADRAQALVLARMGVSPDAFQPRDYTRGTQDLTRTTTAPGANVAGAMQRAAADYRPGQGGYDTTTLKMLLDRMKGSGFSDRPGAPTAGAPTTPSDYPTRTNPAPSLPAGSHPRTPLTRNPNIPPAAGTPPAAANPAVPPPLDANGTLRRRLGIL